MRALFNYRYYVLFLLGMAGMVCLLCEPTADDMANWAAIFIVSKAFAVVALYTASRLLVKWYKRGELKELSELMEE